MALTLKVSTLVSGNNLRMSACAFITTTLIVSGGRIFFDAIFVVVRFQVKTFVTSFFWVLCPAVRLFLAVF